VPRAFTAEETDRIRDRLKKAGKDAFARRGIRGTTVDELAWAAAISKGAFYRFFDSKESLLLALLDDYEITMQAEIVEAVRREPGRSIDVLIDSALHAIGHNPLLPVLMSEEGLRVIHSRPPAEQEALLERDVRLVERVLAVLREAGMTLTVSDRVLLGLLRSLVFVGQHRADIGEDLVEEVGGWLKRSMRTALLPSSEQGAR
jgi:AcrR family transcriptional regulator